MLQVLEISVFTRVLPNPVVPSSREHAESNGILLIYPCVGRHTPAQDFLALPIYRKALTYDLDDYFSVLHA